jgi:hypothetical protein
MKSLEIKVPAAPESTTAVVSTVFRRVLEIRVIRTHSSFRSPIACTSLTVTLEDTDVIPVFHIKILRKAAVLRFIVFFLDLFLPNWDLLLLLLRAAIGTVASLLAYEAQAFSHAIGAFFFVETVYVDRIVETQVSMGVYRPYCKTLYWTC